MTAPCPGKKGIFSLSVEDIIHTGGLILYLAVVFLPAGALFCLSFLSYVQDPFYYLEYLIPDIRQFSLFFTSIFLSFTVSAGTMATGFFAAVFLWRTKIKILANLKWLIFILIPVPPYVYALSCSSAAGVAGVSFTGWTAVYFVYLISFLPFSILICLLGLASVKSDFIDAGRIFSPDGEVFSKIIAGLSKPFLIAGGIIIFLLCLMDYSVPSLYSRSVYPLEIFAEYSSSGDTSGAFLMALPLVFISVLLVLTAVRYIKEISWEFSKNPDHSINQLKFPGYVNYIKITAFLIAFAGVFVLFITLISETGSAGLFFSSVTNAMDNIRTTIVICFISSVVCIPAALAVSKELIKNHKYSNLWWILVLFPLVLPPPLTGMGLISLWNGFMPFVLHGTLIVPVFALLSRFTSFAVIILFVFSKSGDTLLIDAAQIFSRGYLDSLKGIILPLLMPGIAGASALFFALGLGELGATLIVMPPGEATITMRIYNYLHYGGSETVAGLCLFMTLLTAAAGLIVLIAIKRDNHSERYADD